jgi:MoaA/NifB/PqqE/SkfB family radical SAM enzyme
MDVSLANFGVLQIEPTDHCNLRCNMCLPHHLGFEQIHGVPKGLMDLGLYRRIVDGLAAEDCRFDHMIFQWLGDPSLHPGLEDMLAHAQDRLHAHVGYLRVDTNAIVLTPKRMDRLVQVYARRPELPMLLVFTLDAATPETYLRVKGQDALERVRRHIRHFIMRRAQLALSDVRLNVQLQFVLQPGNEHEVSEFIAYWSDLLRCHGRGRGYNEIMIKRLSVDAGGTGQREADELYERTCREQGVRESSGEHVHVKVWRDRPWESTATDNKDRPRQPCPGMWMTPVIRHDGHLMMCCADLAGELDLGDLGKHSFRKLWEGSEAVQRRLAHVRGAFDEVGFCESCGGINWYGMPHGVVRDWLTSVGQDAAWPAYAKRFGV